MGSVEIPGNVPRERRKSLSAEQIRDPLGTLAIAYGVEPDISHVAAAITQRLPEDAGSLGFEAKFAAMHVILIGIKVDGRNLGRIYRGSPLAKPTRKVMVRSVAFCVHPQPPEEFIDMVCREIRSALN